MHIRRRESGTQIKHVPTKRGFGAEILENHLPPGRLEPGRQKASHRSRNAAVFDIEVNHVRPDLGSNLTAKRHTPALCDSICCMVPRNQLRIASSISS